ASMSSGHVAPRVTGPAAACNGVAGDLIRQTPRPPRRDRRRGGSGLWVAGREGSGRSRPLRGGRGAHDAVARVTGGGGGRASEPGSVKPGEVRQDTAGSGRVNPDVAGRCHARGSPPPPSAALGGTARTPTAPPGPEAGRRCRDKQER